MRLVYSREGKYLQIHLTEDEVSVVEWLVSKNWLANSMNELLTGWFDSRIRARKEEERNDMLASMEHLSTTDREHMKVILGRGNANRLRNLAANSRRERDSAHPTPVRIESRQGDDSQSREGKQGVEGED